MTTVKWEVLDSSTIQEVSLLNKCSVTEKLGQECKSCKVSISSTELSKVLDETECLQFGAGIEGNIESSYDTL